MGTATKGYTPATNDVPTAAQWNAMVDPLYTAVNGTLDEANVDLAGADGLVGKSTTQTITGTKTFADIVTNTITGANAAGPAFIGEEAATATNPTLCPNKAEEDTGFGWGGADIITLITGGTERWRTDAAGQFGLGVTPNTWATGYTAFQLGGAGTLMQTTSAAAGGAAAWSNNAYLGAGPAWTYIANDEAVQIRTVDGTLAIYTAAAGTGAITWGNAKLTLSNAGDATPGGNKTQDWGAAGTAWDDCVADDFVNEADYYFLDDRDDLAAICAIKGSGKIDPLTGFELIDDATVPVWMWRKHKKAGKRVDADGNVLAEWAKGDVMRSDDGTTPYLSTKLLDSLQMGAIRQLTARVKALEAR